MMNLTSQWRAQEHRALKRVLEKVFAYLKLTCEQPPKWSGAKQKIEPSVAERGLVGENLGPQASSRPRFFAPLHLGAFLGLI